MSYDESGLTFEEWQPELVFSPKDMDANLTISGGHIKVDRETRGEVFWGDQQPPTLTSMPIISVDDEWVRYGRGSASPTRALLVIL